MFVSKIISYFRWNCAFNSDAHAAFDPLYLKKTQTKPCKLNKSKRLRRVERGDVESQRTVGSIWVTANNLTAHLAHTTKNHTPLPTTTTHNQCHPTRVKKVNWKVEDKKNDTLNTKKRSLCSSSSPLSSCYNELLRFCDTNQHLVAF